MKATQAYRQALTLRERAELLVHKGHLSAPEAAAALKVCPNTVRRHLARDNIQTHPGRPRLLTSQEEAELEAIVRDRAQRDAMDSRDLIFEVRFMEISLQI